MTTHTSPITAKDSHLTDQEVTTTIELLLKYLQETWWEYEDLLASDKIIRLQNSRPFQIAITEYIQNLFALGNSTADHFIVCLQAASHFLERLES